MRSGRLTGVTKRTVSSTARSQRTGSHGRLRAGAGRPSVPASGQVRLPRRRGAWVLVLALLAAAGVVVAASLVAGGKAGGPDPDRVAQLREQEERRFAAQVAELTELARSLHAALLPVLTGLHEVSPDDGAPLTSSDDLRSWRAVIDDSVAKFGDPPSGSTATNMVREGLHLSVRLLGSALTAYESALAAEGDERQRLHKLAVDLRSQAVDAWSIAATQLDQLNTEVGNGHVHLYLSTNPDAAHHGHG